VFTRCLFCHRDFPPNSTLEHFPLARKLAYDPVRGRLWAICPTCQRWNLAPLEERWEALDELEKFTRDKARLLAQTENIALLKSGELEAVRVGKAELAEEAWWRYGRELLRRKQQYRNWAIGGVAVVGTLVAGGAVAGVTIGGGWYMLWRLGQEFPMLGRTLQFGRTAWEGKAVCQRCGGVLTSIPFRHRGVLIPRPEANTGLSLTYRCPTCSFPRRHGTSADAELGEGSGFRLEGVEAEHVLRRVLAYHHYAGADVGEVKSASRLIQDAGSARALSVRVAARRRELVDLDPTEGFALEIAVNEEAERRMLQMELTALEERWQEEEEIASIIDTELTWLPDEQRRHGDG
jgi:hypothetical protein